MSAYDPLEFYHDWPAPVEDEAQDVGMAAALAIIFLILGILGAVYGATRGLPWHW